jgi:hypothetical protein
MKNHLLIFSLLVTVLVHGQYFQNLNGTPNYDQTVDAALAPGGYLIAGRSFFTGREDLLLTRTGANGQVGFAPQFNQLYQLTTITQQPLNAHASKVFHLANGNIFVVGSFTDAGGYGNVPGIFTATFTANGIPLNCVGWWLANPQTYYTLFSTAACLALAPADTMVYVSGVTDGTAPNVSKRMFVLSINTNNNTLIWGNIYNFNTLPAQSDMEPADMVASPWQLQQGVQEIVVVGNYLDRTNNTDQIYALRINRITGNPVAPGFFYNSGAVDRCVAVTPAPGLGGGGNGFVIAGHTQSTNGSYNISTIKLNAGCNFVRWSSQHEYSNAADQYGSDIIVRQNTLGVWNYYVSGWTVIGVMGNPDVVVYVVDDLGNSFLEYTYGTPEGETSEEILNVAGTPSDGIAIFGMGPGAIPGDISDEYYVKAYYNGESGCNDSLLIPQTLAYTLNQVQRTPVKLGRFDGHNKVFQSVYTPVITVLCNNVVVPGGNNTRLTQPESLAASQSDAVALYPNPSVSGLPVQLVLNTPQDGEVRVTVYDISGREIEIQYIQAAKGRSNYPLQLPSGLSAGVYMIRVEGAGIYEVQRIAVE